MSFPVYLELGPVRLHPHLLAESVAYALGLWRMLSQRGSRAPGISGQAGFDLLVWALGGAMLGSKCLAWLEHLHLWQGGDLRSQLAYWIGGKTVVGGLLGGYLGVAWKKRALGIRKRTGDPLVTSLIIGIAVGRIGCFLSGLSDETYGLPAKLPWAIDFGDGPRHPTQLYEIAWLGLVYAGLQPIQSLATTHPGLRFQCFLGSYLGFRLLIEGLKPRGTIFFGLSPIQWAAVFGLLVVLVQLSNIIQRSKETAHA